MALANINRFLLKKLNHRKTLVGGQTCKKKLVTLKSISYLVCWYDFMKAAVITTRDNILFIWFKSGCQKNNSHSRIKKWGKAFQEIKKKNSVKTIWWLPLNIQACRGTSACRRTIIFIDIIILQRVESLLSFISTIVNSLSLPSDITTVSQLIKNHPTNRNSPSCLSTYNFNNGRWTPYCQ